jgi:hypothetical protein
MNSTLTFRPKAWGCANLRWWASQGVRWQITQGWPLRKRDGPYFGGEPALLEVVRGERQLGKVGSCERRQHGPLLEDGLAHRQRPEASRWTIQGGRCRLGLFDRLLRSYARPRPQAYFFAAKRRCAHKANSSLPFRLPTSASNWSRGCLDKTSDSTGGLRKALLAGFLRDDPGSACFASGARPRHQAHRDHPRRQFLLMRKGRSVERR